MAKPWEAFRPQSDGPWNQFQPKKKGPWDEFQPEGREEEEPPAQVPAETAAQKEQPRNVNIDVFSKFLLKPTGMSGIGPASAADLLSMSLFKPEDDPRLGGVARGSKLIGSGIEAVSRLAEAAPDTLTATAPAIEAIRSVSPKLQEWANSFKNWGEEINYEPSTQLGDIPESPAKIVPFIIERVIQSLPDMIGATTALPAYIPALANEILNDRLKNDDRTIEQATVGDVAAATAAAAIQGPLERFATRRLMEPKGVLGQTAFQAGTEAIQETTQYAAETAGTKVGFDPAQAGLVALEAGIVGGGLGAGAGAVGAVERNAVQKRIEERFRKGEDVRSEEELIELDRIKDQALQDAQSIAVPEIPAEAAPLDFGSAYSEKIYDSIGQYIPINEEFKVEEKVVDGVPRFVVTDRNGTQYGQALENKDQADALSSNLNSTTQERAKVLEELYPLQRSLSEMMKGYGLNDIGVSLDKRIFTRRGEALTSEGIFDPVSREIFLAVNAIDPDGTRDYTQRKEALRGVLRHEVVHALRYLDLWKKSEWKNLEKTVSQLKKPGTEDTYLQIASRNYGDQSQVIQVEEAVADLIRDVAGNLSKVAGKPRSLSERAIRFFDRAQNALTGAGFQTYEDIVRRVEEGIVGSRQRGRIRTLRATEEQMGYQGITPERIQPLFATPEERNQVREEATQRMQAETPATSEPALNSLRLNATRESRTAIERVPETIKVDGQEVPTRDSEGRLIYSGYEGPEVFGMETRPTQEGIQNFWRWFGKSKFVGSGRRPLLGYHGTSRNITEFAPKQAGSVFISLDPKFSESFAADSLGYMVKNFTDFMSDQQVLDVLDETLQSASAFTPKTWDQVAKIRANVRADVNANRSIRASAIRDLKNIAGAGASSRFFNSIQTRLPSAPNLIPVYVKAENPFDYDNSDHIKRVLKKVKEISPIDLTSDDIDLLKKGDWVTIEGSEGNAPILDAIRQLGFDSMYVEEAGRKNIAVFNPNQIKSAIGNNGDFSPLTPSIRESRVPNPQVDTPQFKRFFGDSKVIDESGKPLVMYHNTNKDFSVFRPSDIGIHIGTIDQAESRIKSKGIEGSNTIPLYASIKNPLRLQDSRSWADPTWYIDESGIADYLSADLIEEARGLKDVYRKNNASEELRKSGRAEKANESAAMAVNKKVVDELESQGYDGIVYANTRDGSTLSDRMRADDSYIAFKPNQLKSAIGNVGSFDITKPSIRESRKPIQVRMPRIPGVMEDAPILPIGDVEQSLIDLFKQTNSPTSEQLAQMPGAPTKRTIKDEDGRVSDDPRDTEVRPISMDELREMARSGLRNSRDLLWYMKFGTGFSNIVGPANLGEASVIFGVTSQQNSAEQNFADTLHIMRLAREIDPVANPRAFENAVRNRPRPDGQRLKITGDQINRIIRLYREGFAEAGLKTSTYMQLIQDRAENRFNPFSVQDVHMARVYGFRRKERDPDSGNLIDGAKIPGDLQYRYAQFLTSKLAEEFGVSPDRMQAALWFYAKTQLSPKEKGAKPGTWESARSYSQPEIDYINGMVERGEFDKNQALTPALREGVRPQNAIKTVIAPYSNTAQAEQLLELARQRAPTALVSATPGNARGYGFPDGTSMELITQFNRDAIRAITDQDGQIPFLRELGLPHEVRLGYGTYGVLEPNIQIKLLGGTPQQAKIVANVLGDALLQDAAIFGQPTQKADRVNNFGVAVTKADRSEFTIDELAKIADAVNPTKATDDGINFTLIQPNVLSFLDSRSFGDGYEADSMLPEFHANITSLLPSDMDFEADFYTQEGDYFGHQDYKSRIEEAWSSGSLGGSPDIFQRIDDTLYQSFWNEYTRFRDANNLGPAGSPRPESFFSTAPVAPRARESRLTGPASFTEPGPSTDVDTTGAAEALNEGQPVNSLGIPIGPLLTYTMPDGTVAPRIRESRQEPIRGAKLNPMMKRLIRGVEFFESAPDKLRGGVGLGDVASRIENYFDTWDARLGEVNGLIRQVTSSMSRKELESAKETFERYMRARETKRPQDAEAILKNASQNDRQLILVWDRVTKVTGRVNRDVRDPDGDPIKVYDAKKKEWRDIGTLLDFFPRTTRREVLEVMMNPDVDPVLYDQLLDAVVAAGKAKTKEEAEDFLLKDYFTDEVRNDYFAGLAKARTEALPEIFYDYSWDAATRYLSKWARRTSQIEFFGQELGPLKKDWFDTNIPKIRNRETQEYLNQIRNSIYEVEVFGVVNNMMRWANQLATGLQLGNPASAFLNLVGGDVANIQMYGWKEVAKAHAALLLDWKKVQEEGTSLGILNKDYLRILQDGIERDAGKYFATDDKISVALGKFTNATLTFSGFNGAENIVRATAMLAARGFLNNSLKAINKNPNSAKSKKFIEFAKRENLDLDKLILENGAGPETDKYLRRGVNVPQGSYRIDMTPVFVDTNWGRFFFKYQKFGTQINRFFYRNFLKPWLDEPTDVVKLLRLLAFLLPSVFGGEIINQFRRFLGYGGDYGPTYAQISKAFEKDETAKAWGLIFSRAMQNATVAGSFGFAGNYYQFSKDVLDQQRVKNPMSPPGLASIDALVDLGYRVIDQGRLTARDMDEIAENTMSFYRANKRIALAGASELGSDAKEVKRFAAQRDIREIRRYGLRYAQDMEIEGKRQRSLSGPPVRTELTPTNKAIVDALYQGDSSRARVLMRDAMKGKNFNERNKISQSIRASIRNRQPIQIGGSAPSSQERLDFLRWARKNLSAEEYQKIATMDRNYRLAAARINMGFGD